jgi:hypothetical protein
MSARDIWAVGGTSDRTRTHPTTIALHWNGRTWQ